MICQPKELGGIGLRKVGVLNKSLLAKLAWRVAMQNGGFWCRVLREKYCSGRGDGLDFVDRKRDSKVWKGVVQGS